MHVTCIILIMEHTHCYHSVVEMHQRCVLCRSHRCQIWVMCCALHSVQWEAEMFEEVESTHLWCISTTVRMVTPTVTPPRGGIVKHTWFSEDALNQLLAGWPHDKNSSSVTYATCQRCCHNSHVQRSTDALLVKRYPRTELRAQIMSQGGLEID